MKACEGKQGKGMRAGLCEAGRPISHGPEHTLCGGPIQMKMDGRGLWRKHADTEGLPGLTQPPAVRSTLLSDKW